MTRGLDLRTVLAVAVLLGASSCGADNGRVWPSDAADGVSLDAQDLEGDADAREVEPDAERLDAASACADDPFGASSEEAPIPLEGALELSEMVACAAARDWFELTSEAGALVEIEVSAGAPVGLVVGEGEERRRIGPSATPSASLVAQGARVRFAVEGGAEDVAYSLVIRYQAPPETDAARVRGVVRYQDRAFDAEGFTGELAWVPASGVRVQVVSESEGAVAAEAFTQDEGAYALDFDALEGERYLVRVAAVGFYDGFQVEVRDRSGASAVHSMESPILGAAEEGVHVLDLDAPADAPMGGALNVVDQVLLGFRFMARFSDERSPTLRVYWEPGLSYSCGSCYLSNAIRLGGQLEDPDEYDDDIILHEFAHYAVHHFGHDDSPGGAHRDRRVGPRLAYGEGLAYFLSSAMRDDPTMVDTFLDDARFIDYEAVTLNGESLEVFFGTSDGTAEGRLREEIPAALLWDVYDAASDAEPWDTVSMGDDMLRVLFDVLRSGPKVNVGPRGMDITDAFNAFACALGETEGLQALMDEREFPWSVAEALRCPE